MKNDIDNLLDEFYKYELHISEIYASFTYMYEKDAAFWWQLSLEEKNHAALIASIKQIFAPIGKLPSIIKNLTVDINEIENENRELDQQLANLKKTMLSRKEAFLFAITLEKSAIENHYQVFMSRSDDIKIDKMFRDLNRYDKDHADRIRRYMEDNNI